MSKEARMDLDRQREKTIRKYLVELGKLGCRKVKLRGNIAAFEYDRDNDIRATISTKLAELDSLESSSSSSEELSEGEREELRLAQRAQREYKRERDGRHTAISLSSSSDSE